MDTFVHNPQDAAMSISRRHCLLWGAGLASGSLLSACAHQPDQKIHTGPGFRQQRLGKALLTAVSDGVGRRPLDAGFVKNAPLQQVQAALAAANLPITHLDVPYTCFVIELNDQRYLLDSGFADNGAAGTGHLHTHLRAAGIDPTSIDHVIISHLHGDHIQGLRRKDGSLVYPNALVHVPEPEIAFWMDDARMQALPESARGGFQTVRRVFAQYPQDRIRQFVPGSELAPGIQTIAAFGHAPGHTAVRVRSEGERFTYIADAAHLPVLFVRHPDWQVQFDMHPEQARTTRQALLQHLAAEGDWVGGYHFPLPGIGRVHQAGAGYDWVPRQ